MSFRADYGWRALALVVAGCLGCGGGGNSVRVPKDTAPVITQQPADESVPMGLGATFSVGASGQGLSYQWMRGGTAIAGATGSSYTLPSVANGDSGAAFSVQVSNDAGSVTSRTAALTVTARAPKPGDLRFQQVDAVSTVNGYGTGQTLLTSVNCPPPGGGGMALTFPGMAGAPFKLMNNACDWEFPLLYGPLPGTSAISTVYYVTYASSLEDSLSQSYASVPAANDPGSVIIALGRTPVEDDVVSVGYMNEGGVGAFTPEQQTVDEASFQAAATEEGQHGRVITALDDDGGEITYFSYGWAGDASSTYETKVVSGTLDTASDMVTELAAEGYIVTATYCSEAADGSGVWMVGTRLQGDTMPRPVLSVPETQVQQLLDGGYAVVAVVMKFSGDSVVTNQYIGER